MNKQYKIDLIHSLYGIIEGAYYAHEMAEQNFKRKYPNLQFKISQTKIHRSVEFPDKEPPNRSIFGGCVTLTLIIENEAYSIERDWGIEVLIDTKHPDYYADDWFYDSDKCYADKVAKKLIEDLNNEKPADMTYDGAIKIV